MSTYTMNVVDEFNDNVDYALLNLNLLPLNHSQNIEDVFYLAETKTGGEMAIVVLCCNKALRENIQDIGKKINNSRKPWDKVPIVVVNPYRKHWQEKIVGFYCDVWAFAEKGIPEDQTSWITDLYGTRAKL